MAMNEESPMIPHSEIVGMGAATAGAAVLLYMIRSYAALELRFAVPPQRYPPRMVPAVVCMHIFFDPAAVSHVLLFTASAGSTNPQDLLLLKYQFTPLALCTVVASLPVLNMTSVVGACANTVSVAAPLGRQASISFVPPQPVDTDAISDVDLSNVSRKHSVHPPLATVATGTFSCTPVGA